MFLHALFTIKLIFSSCTKSCKCCQLSIDSLVTVSILCHPSFISNRRIRQVRDKTSEYLSIMGNFWNVFANLCMQAKLNFNFMKFKTCGVFSWRIKYWDVYSGSSLFTPCFYFSNFNGFPVWNILMQTLYKTSVQLYLHAMTPEISSYYFCTSNSVKL
jgi:hypothetical protein